MSKRIGKIAKDWATTRFAKMPTEEIWYQDRIAICGPCEYNSENVTETNKYRDLLKGSECQGKRHCTACGCCINQKASMKTSVCGLEELGIKPKWSAIEMEDDAKYFFTVENLTPENHNLQKRGKPGDEKYVINFEKTDKVLLESRIKLSSPYKCEYITIERDCNCFPIEIEQKEDHILILCRISTKEYRNDIVTSKRFTIVFNQDKGEGKANFLVEFIKKENL